MVEVVTGDMVLEHPLKVNAANYCIAEGSLSIYLQRKTSNLNMSVVGPSGSSKSFRLASLMLSQLCGIFDARPEGRAL